MKLNEITMKGPGDYWPGDEHNPRSPDYDDRAGRSGRSSSGATDSTDYVSDRDRLEDKRTKGAANWGNKAVSRTAERFESGEKNGQPYNVAITFTGDDKWEAERLVKWWMDNNNNILVLHRPVVEYNDSTAHMYVLLDPQHLTYQYLRRQSK